MTYRTEQEAFWAGEFGTDYAARNENEALFASNLSFFARALRQAQGVGSCIEFGANIGMNLRALRILFPSQEQFGVEINPEAARRLGEVIPPANVAHASILQFSPPRSYDLVLVKGVLIHINPEALPEVYDKLVLTADKYVLIAEYYNPAPVEITYRGHANRLFKRDFAGEMMDRHPALSLVDYGFTYRRDPNFPQDDVTWFLMAKRATPAIVTR